MKDLLPPQLLRILRDRYLGGVADAEAKFTMSKSDEDALTGALGQSISMAQPLGFRVDNHYFEVKISYEKIRGRGPEAPEKKFGTDGIFQIEIFDASGRIARQKALPFQAKTGWLRKNTALSKQAALLVSKLKSGIVVDYSENGYVACSADYVAKVDGRRKDVETAGLLRPLGQILAHDFLDCTMGEVGLFYDSDTETFNRPVNFPRPDFAITTTIKRTD